jgi:hypothetical protein
MAKSKDKAKAKPSVPLPPIDENQRSLFEVVTTRKYNLRGESFPKGTNINDMGNVSVSSLKFMIAQGVIVV